MNSIDKAKEYLPLLDEVYKASAKTSILEGDEATVKLNSHGEIEVAKLDMDGLGDFDRNTGYTNGTASLKWETIKNDKERSEKFKIDRLDDEESLKLSSGKLMGEFMRTKVVPETDAARIAKIVGQEGITVKEEDLTTGEEVVKGLRACDVKMTEDEVPAENRILFITPTHKALVDDLDSYKSKEVMKKFSTIIEVPQTRMYTKIVLNSGETNYGYKKAEDAKNINFVVVEKSSTVVKLAQFLKYFSPDEDQEGDNHIFPYRNNNLYGYTYENKRAGVYCSHASS